jgi:Zn-dependent protease with chaperone function
MMQPVRCVLGLLAGLAVAAGHAVELAYEPIALGWSTDEVELASSATFATIVQRAERAQQMGCSRHCERLQRTFDRLADVARTQRSGVRQLPWVLTVVRLPDVDALALPGGQIIVSESFIDQRGLTDDALAFVLAHEMAHSILEHERQALTFARLLLPRDVPRTVRDMYTEIDYNFALLQAMEPVLHQGEFEADELGLLLASVAGFAPDRQLAFIEMEAAEDTKRRPLLSTHPSPQLRLDRLRASLPLARRLTP